MHLTHSNPLCLDTFWLDGSNLTQSKCNPWIQTGPMSPIDVTARGIIFHDVARSRGARREERGEDHGGCYYSTTEFMADCS